MAEDRSRLVERINATLAGASPEPAKVSVDRAFQFRRTGYRFAKGDAVIDVGTGKRATVDSSRPGVKGSDAIYELRFADGSRGARLDSELEADPTPPTVQP